MTPIVKLRQHKQIANGYYKDGDGNFYGVARLIALSKDLEVFTMPLAGIRMDFMPWSLDNAMDIAHHFSRSMEADLEKPIILDWNGCVADGWHRIIKALYLKRSSLPAVRLTDQISPCEAAK